MRSYWWSAVWLCAALVDVSSQQDDDESINLTPTGTQMRCLTKDGKDGICVHYMYCNDKYMIEPYGILDSEDLRIVTCDANRHIWCCIEPRNITVNPWIKTNDNVSTSTDSESLVDDDSCPWCVALYRSGGNPHTRSKSGLYCGGAALSARVVLTSATCILSARAQPVTARAAGGRPVAVMRHITHPDYNSGTRRHDVALLFLAENLGIDDVAPLGKDPGDRDKRCRIPNWRPDDGGGYSNTIVQLRLSSVLGGRCDGESKSETEEEGARAVCARVASGERCEVSVGSPLVCGGEVVGVVSGGGCGAAGANATGVRGWWPGGWATRAMLNLNT